MATRPELRGTFGMVASTHWLASAAGMAMLERGGNAFDAAVATGLVIQVVEPHMGGPGGEVPILLRDARDGRVRVICGQGTTPAAATPAAFRDLGLTLVPGTGPLAACVPGAFDAWMLLLRDFGTLELADVIAPAIHYAQHGYPLLPGIRATIAAVEALFREEWTSSGEVYLPRGELPRAGELFRNEALATTYQRIVDDARRGASTREGRIDAAREAFYGGWVAEAIGDWVRETPVLDPRDGQHRRGLLTAADLAGWRARVEDPVSIDYRGHTVFKTGPWGQGPVMLQQLKLLEGFELDALGTGADFVHTFVECAKLAFADREAWYGDPDFGPVPLATLLSAEYAAQRRALVGAEASGELRPGTVDGVAPRLPPLVAAASIGEAEPTRRERRGGDTSHLDVADRFGNVVSATPSGGWLDGAPLIPALGFCLGTRAQMLWLDEGLPSSMAPRKRPRTTLTPTLVLRDGEAPLAIGTPGGDSQDQWALVALLRHLHGESNVQAAIDAPCFATNHVISSFHPRGIALRQVEIEDRAGSATIDALRARGHDVVVEGPWSLGLVCAAGRERSGILHAAASPRMDRAYAVGR